MAYSSEFPLSLPNHLTITFCLRDISVKTLVYQGGRACTLKEGRRNELILSGNETRIDLLSNEAIAITICELLQERPERSSPRFMSPPSSRIMKSCLIPDTILALSRFLFMPFLTANRPTFASSYCKTSHFRPFPYCTKSLKPLKYRCQL